MERYTMSYNEQNMVKPEIKQHKIVISASTLIDCSMIVFFSSSFFRLIFSKILIGMRTGLMLQVALDIVIFVPLLLGLFMEYRAHKKGSFAFLLLFILVFCYFELTLLMHPTYASWFYRETYGVWDTVFRFDKGGIYGFLYFSLIKDGKRLFKNLKNIAFLSYVVLIYQYLQYLSNGYWTEMSYTGDLIRSSYSLDFGYNAIFIFILFISFFLVEHKKTYLILSIPALILMIMCGSRGPLLVALTFILIYTIRFILKADFKRKWLYIGLILVTAMILVLSFNYITAYIVNVLTNMNLSSRTLQSLISNNLFDDSGRSVLSNLANSAINEGPFFGYGAFGDRPIIGPYYAWGYCHNILLEFQVDFGGVPGIIMLFIIGYYTLRRFYQAIDNKQFIVILCVFAMCMRLVLSGTFWGDEFFWALLAIIFTWKNTNNNVTVRI